MQTERSAAEPEGATVHGFEITRVHLDLLNGARAIMADPDRVVLHPKKNAYETRDGERRLLDDDETFPGVRCSFATCMRQAAIDRGMGRFDHEVNDVFGMLHIEVAGRGYHSLDTALTEDGREVCLDVIDAVLERARA